ncbi:MAG TPA: UDP-N-acetylglucosamine 2-epimerase (non-hydrolyzing) [Burkholderiales bacterium]|nr:UDP-N-acetylglucosamine 2-epimerase (non-hydrolyzing) [Burkholderiales bacterium]
MRQIRITCVIGTRPEAIKMAPVIQSLTKASWCRCTVLSTAQHRDLLDQVLQLFGIKPDADLGVMQPNQTLSGLTSRLMERFDRVLSDARPDALLAQGDTTTSMAAALASFYHKVPFGHVEAGLRTGNLYGPFPEEMNRLVASRIARWHFAPTEQARANLLAEGINPACVYVTGNTVIDALLDVAGRCPSSARDGKRLVLVTAHRRENFGARFAAVCRAIRHLADAHEDVEFLYPVHPNPNVRQVAFDTLGGHPRIRLVAPLDYQTFVAAMKQCHFVLTDSGGVQEEAPALGKPVLVLRDETERPEAVAAGVVRLVGTDFQRVVGECARLLLDPAHYASMSRGVSPYGDGHAAARIALQLERDASHAHSQPQPPAARPAPPLVERRKAFDRRVALWR